MRDERTVIQVILQEVPASVRELAREAGVSHGLLLAIRDGERGMTPATREAVVGALRRWSERCAELAEALDAAKPREGGDDGE